MRDGRGPKPKSLSERFLSKVGKADAGSCWPWLAFKNNDGYGRLHVGTTFLGAHRVSWEIHNGVIPETKHVLHRCDNPCCVNPDHLFLGTNLDNVKDKIGKGRQARGRKLGVSVDGESNGFSKLTNADVIAIRSSNEPDRIIAEQFGITRSNVNYIKLRKTWKHLP